MLGYHPLHDETGSQRTTRRQNDAKSRAHRRRLRQVQRGVTPSQTSSQPGYHVSVSRSPHSRPSPQPGHIAPGIRRQNFMDPEEFPAHLPELDDTEEMLIARCHVHAEVQRYRGAQYKYAGHTVYFICRTRGKSTTSCPGFLKNLKYVNLSNTLR
jgi:uncharacterized protein DUF6570